MALDLGLAGKVVLVTGGSRGIGLACAKRFAEEGAKVAIASRDAGRLAKAADALAAAGLRVHIVAADLRKPEDAEAMAAEVERTLGPIDVLVNSAGGAVRTPPDELKAEHWRAAMDAKFFTVIHATQAVMHGMAARGRGAIVNIVGLGGKVPTLTHLPGGSANAALMLASAGLARALAPKGVRVNVINPGLVATERMHEGFKVQARMTGQTLEEVHAEALRGIPAGRIAEADDVARVALFLASDAAAFVSAAAVTVDGATSPLVF